jgi:hypothetical protein
MSKNLFRAGIAIVLAIAWLSFGLASSNAGGREAAFSRQMRLLPADAAV